MALGLSKDFTFAPNTVISSSEVNTDFDELYNAFAGLEAGTASMSKLPLDADPTSALYAATKQYVDAYAGWKRPVLIWSTVTTVFVEANTGTANQTKIIFPDGNYRSVTEDVSSTNKYRLFDITATAEYTSGTEDSGLRSGISETNNLWYAIYAVKSLINTANFVLVGDTTLPLTANFSTLNGRYGTSSWVYLGMIKNGDNSGATSSILRFKQVGNTTQFINACTSNCGVTLRGTRLASTAGATSLKYTYSTGTGATDIPDHCDSLNYMAYGFAASASRIRAQSTGATMGDFFAQAGGSQAASIQTLATNVDDVTLSDAAGNSLAMDINLVGWIDEVLGVGSNPLI